MSSLLSMSFLICASGPPEEGLEIRGGAGYSDYRYRTQGGCTGTSRTMRATDVRLSGEMSYRSKSGLGVTGGVNLARTRIKSSRIIDDFNSPEDSVGVGEMYLSPIVVVRPSAHLAYGGAEIGLGIGTKSALRLYGEGTGAESFQAIFPLLGVRSWIGDPESVYAWGELLAGHVLPDTTVVLGLGPGSTAPWSARTRLASTTARP